VCLVPPCGELIERAGRVSSLNRDNGASKQGAALSCSCQIKADMIPGWVPLVVIISEWMCTNTHTCIHAKPGTQDMLVHFVNASCCQYSSIVCISRVCDSCRQLFLMSPVRDISELNWPVSIIDIVAGDLNWTIK